MAALQAEAIQAAKADGPLIASYNYTNLEGPGSDYRLVETRSTASFAADYTNEIHQLSPSIVQAKSQSTATVSSEALTSFSSNQAVVTVTMSQSVSRPTANGPITENYTETLKVTLVDNKGSWLIDNLAVTQ